MKRESFKIWVFVIAVVVIPITMFGIVKWYENRYQRLPVLGPENHVVGAFEFSNQYGKPITDKTFDDKIVVANFFFTYCSVICPKMVNNLKRLQAYAKVDFAIVSFSVDPERDSVGRLNAYAEKFNLKGDWHLLTGDKRELYRYARNDLMIVATDGDGGPDDFIHSENLVLVDKQKRIRGYYKGTDETEVNRLLNDIKKLKVEDN